MRTRTVTIALAILLLALAPSAMGQDAPVTGSTPPVGQGSGNVKLRLQLDRDVIKVCEPIYLSMTAEQFDESAPPSVQVRFKDEAPIDLGPMEKQWQRATPLPTIKRMGVMLLDTTVGQTRRYIFDQPGVYHLRIKIGPDITPLKVTVDAGSLNDAKAFAELTPENAAAIFAEAPSDPPTIELVSACEALARKYPDSSAADYCRSYAAIAGFKNTAQINKRGGGKLVWDSVAEQLLRVLPAHQKDFFGEEVGYYTAYSQGLCHEYIDVVKTIDSIPTRMTAYGDLMYAMKREVASHLRPQEVKPPATPAQ